MTSYRTALVAGAAGFIGVHLCEALIERGLGVIGMDNFGASTPDALAGLFRSDRFRFIEHDITDPLPELRQVDLVFNLACPASPWLYQAAPIHTMLTNVLGTNRLLALCEANYARFIQASTSEVYGDPDVHPQPESYRGNVNAIGPRACYDEGKRAAEALCFDYLRHQWVDARVARIFNTYGPGMRADDGRVVPNMVSQALAGLPITIYGDGTQTRSFCYVTDTVDALIKLAMVPQPIGGPVNVGNPNEISIATLARRIVQMTGTNAPIVHAKLPVDDPARRSPDIRKAAAVLGWRPTIQLAEGLARTIEAAYRESRQSQQAHQ